MNVVVERSSMTGDCTIPRSRPVLVTDVELTAAAREPRDARGYAAVRALIRVRGTPIGEVTLPLAGVVDEEAIRRAAIDRLPWPILRQFVRGAIGRAGERPRTADALLDRPPEPMERPTPRPTVTVAV